MAIELELKTVLDDPRAVRDALRGAGARLRFEGMMRDRRLDRRGELAAADRVLRLRVWESEAAASRTEVGWKGPATRTADGYKQREEVEFSTAEGPEAERLFQALGFTEVQAIDRYVEVYELEGTVARLEWYPRMDVLLEIEGEPEGMERLIRIAGLPRSGCTADSLAVFTERFARRTGRPALLAEAELSAEPAGWVSR